MLASVSTAITTVLGWVGTVVNSLLTENGDLHALLGLFAIGIAVSAIMLGVKMIRSLIWAA